MRLSTMLKLAAVAAIGLAVALIAVVKSIDFNQYKGFLAQQVRGATGRDLVIAGPLELKLGLVPSVVASGITFANMPSGSRPDMVTAERIEAEVALIPLLSRQVEVRRLVLVNPDLLLETDAKGRANWDMAPATADTPAAAAAGSPPTRFGAREVRIENARVTWRDGRSGTTRRLGVERLVMTPDSGGTLAVQLAGDYDTVPFRIDGMVGGPAALSSGKPFPVKLKGSFDRAVVVVDGSARDPFHARGLDVTLSLQGEELADILTAAGFTRDGQPVPAIGPYKASARLSDASGPLALTALDAAIGKRATGLVTAKGAVRDLLAGTGLDLALTVEADDLAGLSPLAGTPLPSMGPLRLASTVAAPAAGTWKLADLKAGLGGSDLSGELTLTTAGARPRLTGRLNATALTVTDFTTPAAKPGEKLAPKPATAADGRLFPADPLPLEALRGLDAELSLAVGRLALAPPDKGAAALTGLSATLRLDKGRLTMAPLTAQAGGGTVDGDVSLDAGLRGDSAQMALRLTATQVELGKLTGGETLSGGRTEARLTLKGRGHSLRAVMASASGEAVVAVGEARLRNTAIDWAGGDALTQILGSLNPLARAEDSTQLDCAVARFVVKDGIAAADRGIGVETAKVNVIGAGTIDLRTEALDIGITPRARDGIGLSLGGALAQVTRLRGTLAAPSVGVDELGAARTAASVGAAVATGGLSLLGEILLDKANGDGSPCRTALGKPAKSGKRPAKSGGGVLEGLFGR